VDNLICAKRQTFPIRVEFLLLLTVSRENTLDGILPQRYIQRMAWEVRVCDEFLQWYDALDEADGVNVDTSVDLLAEAGPALGRPHVDTLKGSVYINLKELRVQSAGRPLRIFLPSTRAAALI
jgi:hypothetical protein